MAAADSRGRGSVPPDYGITDGAAAPVVKLQNGTHAGSDTHMAAADKSDGDDLPPLPGEVAAGEQLAIAHSARGA